MPDYPKLSEKEQWIHPYLTVNQANALLRLARAEHARCGVMLHRTRGKHSIPTDPERYRQYVEIGDELHFWGTIVGRLEAHLGGDRIAA